MASPRETNRDDDCNRIELSYLNLLLFISLLLLLEAPLRLDALPSPRLSPEERSKQNNASSQIVSVNRFRGETFNSARMTKCTKLRNTNPDDGARVRCDRWFHGRFCPLDSSCDKCVDSFNRKTSPSCVSLCNSPVDTLIPAEANVARVTRWLVRYVQEEIETENEAMVRMSLNESVRGSEDLRQVQRLTARTQKVVGKPGIKYVFDQGPCLPNLEGHDQGVRMLTLLNPHPPPQMAGPSGPLACNRRLRGASRSPVKAKMRIKANAGYVNAVRKATGRLRNIGNWKKMFVQNKNLFEYKRTQNNKYFLVFIPFKKTFLNQFRNMCT